MDPESLDNRACRASLDRGATEDSQDPRVSQVSVQRCSSALWNKDLYNIKTRFCAILLPSSNSTDFFTNHFSAVQKQKNFISTFVKSCFPYLDTVLRKFELSIKCFVDHSEIDTGWFIPQTGPQFVSHFGSGQNRSK